MLDRLTRLDPRFTALTVAPAAANGSTIVPDPDGEIARLFGTQPGTFYLLRPDTHIAGRWLAASPDEIVSALQANLGMLPS